MQPNYFPIGVFILAATLLWAIGQPEWWPARIPGEKGKPASTIIVKDSAAVAESPIPFSAMGILCLE
jgi:hypothetical protein